MGCSTKEGPERGRRPNPAEPSGAPRTQDGLLRPTQIPRSTLSPRRDGAESSGMGPSTQGWGR
eukprot:5238222-Pyramimonas_sp.AAC.1